MKRMEYYKFPAGDGWEFARVDPDDFTAECFDAVAGRWVRMDAYYDEVYHNGNGTRVTEAEALDAVGHLQTA